MYTYIYTVDPLHCDLLFRDVQYIATRLWIPNLSHAKVVIFVYFTYLEQKKKQYPVRSGIVFSRLSWRDNANMLWL